MTVRTHPVSTDDAAYWANIRKQFYLKDDITYLQGGSVGPSARPTIERVVDLLRAFESDPINNRGDNLMGPLLEEAREKLAAFVGAPPDRIALVTNTTMAMNIPAQGLTWEHGSEVLMSDQEYPAVKNLWDYIAERDGLTIIRVPLPIPPGSPEAIIAAFAAGITEKTRVVLFSHVYYTTGLVTPIKAITQLAHDSGAISIIDGAHAVGMAPVNLTDVGCDFYSSSLHKWLLAPKGVGMLYMDAKYQNKVRPLIIGHNMGETDKASRYDLNGTRDLTAHAGLAAAIDFQLDIGWESRIRPYCLGLARYLKEQTLERIRGSRLTIPLDPELSGFLTTFTIEGIDLGKVCQYLWDDYKIEVVAVTFSNIQAFRVSTHFYDSYEDLDRFINAVNQIIATRPDVRKS